MTDTALPLVRPVPSANGATAGPALPARPRVLPTVATLARRRLALSARTPRELVVPLLTPLLFALIIAPALGDTVAGTVRGLDYMTFVAVSTLGLLIPLSACSAGLGVVVDRHSGARRDLLAAPVPRSLIVAGNLVVAVALAGLQVVVLVAAAALRGADFTVTTTGVAWFVATVLAFAVFMYAVAEIMANVIPTQEEYIGALPAVAIVPWFLAGPLFPISALPAGLTAAAKVLPITHVLALLRYGLVDHHGQALRDIWGMSSPTTMAALSLVVVVVSAVVTSALALRVFRRAAVR